MINVIGFFAEIGMFAIVLVLVYATVQIVDVIVEEASHMAWRRKDRTPQNAAEDRDDVSF